MIEFVLEDQTIKLPTAWPEVTISMFTEPAFRSGDPLRLLSALSGVSTDKLANTTKDLTPYFNKVVKFMSAQPNGWRGTLPAAIEIEGTLCTIPQDIELERYGQSLIFGQYIAQHPENVFKAFPAAVFGVSGRSISAHT